MKTSRMKKANEPSFTGTGNSLAGRWWNLHRRSIFRSLAALTLWSLVLMSLLVSIRTLGLTSGVVAELSVGAITPVQAEKQRQVCEIARAFAFEWLSFDGDDDDYAFRMAPYGSFPVPGGEQEVDYVGIASLNCLEDRWRVEVNASLTRYIIADALEAGIPLQRVVRQFVDNGSQKLVYAERIHESYEISIREKAGKLEVIGTPVLLERNYPQGTSLAEMVDDDGASTDLVVFIEQVLPMYYQGENLANYLADGVGIEPASGYQTGKVRVVSCERTNDGVRAAVNVELNDRGTSISQQLVLEACQEDNRWLLTRLGGY